MFEYRRLSYICPKLKGEKIMDKHDIEEKRRKVFVPYQRRSRRWDKFVGGVKANRIAVGAGLIGFISGGAIAISKFSKKRRDESQHE